MMHEKSTPIWREEDGNQRCLCFFVVDLIHFASRRKIINHQVAGGTPESHPRVQDLQLTRLGKPRRGLQILDTQTGFPRPYRNVVIDSIIL